MVGTFNLRRRDEYTLPCVLFIIYTVLTHVAFIALCSAMDTSPLTDIQDIGKAIQDAEEGIASEETKIKQGKLHE